QQLGQLEGGRGQPAPQVAAQHALEAGEGVERTFRLDAPHSRHGTERFVHPLPAPVGLEGDTNSSILVRRLQPASSWSTVTRNPFSAVVFTATALAPASPMASGYVVQYGAGSSTSSSGSSNVAHAS